VIRRVAETLGAKVARLHRVAVGNYLMQSLTSGGIVRLSDIEISQLTQNASDTLIETVLNESAYT
jgi:16S rRNA U516 pseudouridylate synthase RsuA-like enzyme